MTDNTILFGVRDINRAARMNKILACSAGNPNIAQLSELVEGYSFETLRADCKFLVSHRNGYMVESKIKCSNSGQSLSHYRALKSEFDIFDIEPIKVKANKTVASRTPKNHEPVVGITYGYERHVPRVDKIRSESKGVSSAMSSVMW